MSAGREEEILAELVARSLRHPEDGLLQFGSLLGAHQYLRLYRVVGRFIPPGARVLDWGPGNGHFSYFLKRAGYEAEGFSLLEGSFVDWLPGNGYRFARGDAGEPTRLPYPDASFDAVASIGVLEHVRETGGTEEQSLAEIARILRPGGLFVCYHFPNRSSWIDRAARAVPGLYTHAYRFTRADIEKLVQGAGLTLLETGRYGFLPRNSGARLPRALQTSRTLARTWDTLDSGLGRLFPRFCQNHYFVARKTSSRDSSGGFKDRKET